MEALFLKLLNMSITASWLVLAIIAVRLVFRKTPKWTLCLLWGLVAIRLICPFSIESSLSLIPDPELLSQESVYTTDTAKPARGDILDSDGNVIVERHPTTARGEILDSDGNVIVERIDGVSSYPNYTQPPSWMHYVSRVWLIGLVGMIVYVMVSYLLLKRKVATAIPLLKGIKQSEYVDSPFVLGIIRPVIYLPFDMAEGDMAYVIAHEKAHIRRRDHWWKPFGFLLLSVYWFNPVLWVAYILLCRDIEAACDEKVIKDMSREERRAYSTALLNCSIHRRSIAACPLAFGETGVKARVKSVMNYRKPAFWVLLVALILCIVVFVCFMTDPAGMYLYEIDDSRNYSDLLSDIETITLIREGEKSTVSDSDALLDILKEIKVRKFTILRNRNEDRDKTYQIHLKGNMYLNFSADYSLVWIDNGVKPTYSYSVIHTAKVREIFYNLWEENSAGSSRIGSVYTWFDRYSANHDETYPKDSVIELPGMDGISLSYKSSDNEIQMIRSGGLESIISCDWRIQNVFLADLSHDGVSEVCATVTNQEITGVEVYDVAEKQRYVLTPSGTNSYVLSQKAGRLCVLSYDANGYVQDYGVLALGNSNALEIGEPVPEVMALTEKVVCVDVWTRKSTCLSSQKQLDNVLMLLRNLEDQVESASPEEAAAAQEDPFFHSSVIVNYELGEKIICFSENFDIVWEYGCGEAYRIRNPEPIREFINAVTNGVQGRETSGEPFATMDTPWDWCKDISSDAVSAANIYVCLGAASWGNTTSVSTTNGILPYNTLLELTKILNQIPREAFSPERILEREDYHSYFLVQKQGSISVSIADGVNHIAVIIRRSNDKVEMLLTDELEKTDRSNRTYLSPTQIWTIQDDALDAFLLDTVQNPPVINYTVGAEYAWQKPLNFESGDFSMNLRLIEGWEYEHVSNSTNFGIRCRPKGISEGWIYFSFWPEEYQPVEEDRFINDGSYYDWTYYTSYPGSVASGGSFDVRNEVWSYQRYDLETGDYAVINEGADAWFQEYMDQISDIITLSDISVK